MKYRFTLSRNTDSLILEICELNEDRIFRNTNGMITTQIVEDFTGRDYFFNFLKNEFGDEYVLSSVNGLSFKFKFSDNKLFELSGKINRIASPDRYGKTATNYIELIGKTPLIKLSSLPPECKADVLVKLENLEPNSVKDRPVYSIISEAMKRNEIDDETEVIEASSGNVAFALSAILKSLKDRKPRIFISKMHGETKIKAVRVSGCPVVLTAASEGTSSAKRASLDYAASHENVFQLNQHGNPDNPLAHRLTTGPEIYHQTCVLTGQPPAEFVTGLGSGGTAVGVAMFREDAGANFKVIGVEPEEASLNTGGTFNPHKFSGIAPGFITDIISNNREKIDHIEKISKEEGFEVCRRILIEEGLLVGSTSGASIAAAIRRAKLPENEGKVIVTIAHDRGDRYLGIEGLFIPPEAATQKDLEFDS